MTCEWQTVGWPPTIAANPILEVAIGDDLSSVLDHVGLSWDICSGHHPGLALLGHHPQLLSTVLLSAYHLGT